MVSRDSYKYPFLTDILRLIDKLHWKWAASPNESSHDCHAKFECHRAHHKLTYTCSGRADSWTDMGRHKAYPDNRRIKCWSNPDHPRWFLICTLCTTVAYINSTWIRAFELNSSALHPNWRPIFHNMDGERSDYTSQHLCLRVPATSQLFAMNWNCRRISTHRKRAKRTRYRCPNTAQNQRPLEWPTCDEIVMFLFLSLSLKIISNL